MSTVILANGDFPKRGGEAWNLLVNAKRVVACDGAADAFRRRFHRWPDFIVGDLDSVDGGFIETALPIYVADQATNDLTKAINFCREHKWRQPMIVGATGKREDHALGNIFRALEAGLEIVSDYGHFYPVCGKRRFYCAKGSAVSIFAPDPQTQMTSKGLAWPLDGVKFDTLYRATLNRTTAKMFEVTASHLVYVYIARSAQ